MPSQITKNITKTQNTKKSTKKKRRKVKVQKTREISLGNEMTKIQGKRPGLIYVGAGSNIMQTTTIYSSIYKVIHQTEVVMRYVKEQTVKINSMGSIYMLDIQTAGGGMEVKALAAFKNSAVDQCECVIITRERGATKFTICSERMDTVTGITAIKFHRYLKNASETEELRNAIYRDLLYLFRDDVDLTPSDENSDIIIPEIPTYDTLNAGQRLRDTGCTKESKLVQLLIDNSRFGYDICDNIVDFTMFTINYANWIDSSWDDLGFFSLPYHTPTDIFIATEEVIIGEECTKFVNFTNLEAISLGFQPTNLHTLANLFQELVSLKSVTFGESTVLRESDSIVFQTPEKATLTFADQDKAVGNQEIMLMKELLSFAG